MQRSWQGGTRGIGQGSAARWRSVVEVAAEPGAELTSPISPASPRPTGPFFPLRSASLAPVSTSVIRDTHTLVGSVTEMPINKWYNTFQFARLAVAAAQQPWLSQALLFTLSALPNLLFAIAWACPETYPAAEGLPWAGHSPRWGTREPAMLVVWKEGELVGKGPWALLFGIGWDERGSFMTNVLY